MLPDVATEAMLEREGVLSKVDPSHSDVEDALTQFLHLLLAASAKLDGA
jgi:hypothetical protein